MSQKSAMRRLKRMVGYARRYVYLALRLLRDIALPTYAIEGEKVNPLLDKPTFALDITVQDVIMSEIYMSHQGDLLGSGLVPMNSSSYKTRAFNSINIANLVQSRSISKMLGNGYQRLAWHTDFVSGYTWSSRRWYKFISYGKHHGVDVKVPWEFSRCHQLPHLALCFAGDKSDGKVSGHRYVDEVQNQIIDFVSNNPPSYGVNWRTSMDVAIRASNWVMAYSILKSLDVKFKDGFEELYSNSLMSHGRHIASNLEWDPTWRANHYLSNIVGLIFIGASLPDCDEAQGWLAFGVSQLICEVERQVNLDGSNFEASTSYHRLSTEMIVYATAVVLGLGEQRLAHLQNFKTPLPCFRKISKVVDIRLFEGPPGLRGKIPFPPWYFDRLFASAKFVDAVTMPTGHVVLIGDNDSGRFLKLSLTFHGANEAFLHSSSSGYGSLGENLLDHGHLLNAIGGLFETTNSTFSVDKRSADYCIVSALAKGRKAPSPKLDRAGLLYQEETPPDLSRRYDADILNLDYPGASLRSGLFSQAYPDFGLYIYRSDRVYLAVRCGSIGQDGFGGHAHNDQLSITLVVDCNVIINDPGTYTYTRDISLRQRYRSVQAHFAPQAKGLEPGSLEMGLWRLGDEAKAVCLQFDETCFLGRHQGYGENMYRQVRVLDNTIEIKDFWPSGVDFKTLKEQYDSLSERGTLLRFCPAYGVLCE